MRTLSAAFVAAAVAVGAALAGAAPAVAGPSDSGPAAPAAGARAAAGPVAGTFVPVTPFRVADTRTGAGALGAGQVLHVQVGGLGRVPRAHVMAVQLTLSAVAPTSTGTLTAWAAGTSRPAITSLSYRPGRVTTVATLSRVSSTGVLDIRNNATTGRTHVLVDVSGYYVDGNRAATPGALRTLPTPARLANRLVAAGGTLTLAAGGRAGMPSSGLGALAVMITAVAPSRSGGLVAYARGNDRPTQLSAPFSAGHDATSFALVPTDHTGGIELHNASSGPVDVVVDVLGWTFAGVTDTAGALQPRYPAPAATGASIAAGATRGVRVTGVGGVPLRHVAAVIATLTVRSPAHSGSVVAWGAGASPPPVSSVSFAARQSAADLAVVPVSPTGAIRVRNLSAGPLQLDVDVVGFVPATTTTAPPVSAGRYLADLTGDPTTDADLMGRHGCYDAHIGSRLVLLDVGAQTVTSPLSDDNPGVALALTVPTVRLSYPELVSLLDVYLHEFNRCQAVDVPATIAIGTNNDGDYSAGASYTPAERGADWAGQVVNKLDSYPLVTIAGANDIEPGFAGTQDQAQDWETNFLSKTTATLIYNGSADGCPDAFDQVWVACANGWTQKGIYDLASDHAGQVKALPQIYGPSMAAQWANIDATGGGGIDFVGALTQAHLDPTSYRAQSGWSALRYAIGSVDAAPSVPAVTALRIG